MIDTIRTIWRLAREGNDDLIPYVVRAQWDSVKNYFLRFIYAQHNARVIEDFENRMSSIIYEASGEMMSKPYYTLEAMRAQMREHHSNIYNDGYSDGRHDVCAALGVTDPDKGV